MQAYQKQFIEFAIEKRVLRFGQFTLKSGRNSPYFFNSGLFNDGASLDRLGQCYAEAIRDSGLAFDMFFGPAYKGIPLASAVSIAWWQRFRQSLPYCFDRKEEKDHGEGGRTLGAEPHGRVLIIDDVITAGTSVNHSVELIRAAGAEPAGVAIALDRQERGRGRFSAIQEAEQRHGLRVISIISLADVMEYLQESGTDGGELERIRQYQQEYGVEPGPAA
jgi:orotate phosphoribosyltransferase